MPLLRIHLWLIIYCFAGGGSFIAKKKNTHPPGLPRTAVLRKTVKETLCIAVKF